MASLGDMTMNGEQGLHPELSTIQPPIGYAFDYENEPRTASSPPSRPILLIEVPEVRSKTRIARPVYPTSFAAVRGQNRPRGRRRLRREFRLAGCVLAALLPTVLAMSFLHRSATAETAAEESTRPPFPPVVSLSIEAQGVTIQAEAPAPVVFPGYLLPVEGGEETSHAGR